MSGFSLQLNASPPLHTGCEPPWHISSLFSLLSAAATRSMNGSSWWASGLLVWVRRLLAACRVGEFSWRLEATHGFWSLVRPLYVWQTFRFWAFLSDCGVSIRFVTQLFLTFKVWCWSSTPCSPHTCEPLEVGWCHLLLLILGLSFIQLYPLMNQLISKKTLHFSLWAKEQQEPGSCNTDTYSRWSSFVPASCRSRNTSVKYQRCGIHPGEKTSGVDRKIQSETRV